MRVRAENRIYKSMNMRGTAQEVRGMRRGSYRAPIRSVTPAFTGRRGGGSRLCGFLTDSFLTNSASSMAAVGSAFGGIFAAVSV